MTKSAAEIIEECGGVDAFVERMVNPPLKDKMENAIRFARARAMDAEHWIGMNCPDDAGEALQRLISRLDEALAELEESGGNNELKSKGE